MRKEPSAQHRLDWHLESLSNFSTYAKVGSVRLVGAMNIHLLMLDSTQEEQRVVYISSQNENLASRNPGVSRNRTLRLRQKSHALCRFVRLAELITTSNIVNVVAWWRPNVTIE